MANLIKGLRSEVLEQIEANTSREWGHQSVPKGELAYKSYMHLTRSGHLTLCVMDLFDAESHTHHAVEVIDNRRKSGIHRSLAAYDPIFSTEGSELIFEVADKMTVPYDGRPMEPGELEEMLKYIQTLDHTA